MLVSIQGWAQKNLSLKGRIVDAGTRMPLQGATVFIPETGNGNVSERDGSFLFEKIDIETGQIIASFIGYQPDTIFFDFENKSLLEIDFFLLEDAITMSQVEVTGKLEGQMKALAEQRVASNIKNIVDAAQMIQFPDLNAAQSIGRIPGITLQRDQGEGRYVQLRGTPPELSNFSINGEQIPSPEGGIRYVALDVVPIDQLSSIEISKALTPDMDGDAIGGTVNLKTKTAKDSIPELRATLAGGFNNLSEKGQYNVQFAFGQRFGDFGFYMNASFLDDKRASHNMEFDFNESRFSGDTSFRIHYDDVQLRYYDINRQRTGLSGTWDWNPNPNQKITFNVLYNRFIDDEKRSRARYNIGSGFLTSETSSREAKIERDLRDREKIQTISSANLGGEHKFGPFQVDYLFSYSDAREHIPDRMDINFVNDLVNLDLDLSEPNFPRIFYPREKDSVTVHNPADYEFDELLLQNTLTTDKNTTGRINLSKKYFLGGGNGAIKIGGKIRSKVKERNNTGKVYHKYFETFAVNSIYDSVRQIYNQIGPEFSLETVAGSFQPNNLLNKGYQLGITPDLEKSREFIDFYSQNFKLQESDTKEESIAEDFYAEEDIYAAYGMVTHYWNDWMFLGGVRYEKTKIHYEGFDLRFKEFSDAFEGADTLQSDKNYEFLLPQFHLKYSPNPSVNYRAALTWTYSRPNFDDILPYRQSELDSRQISQGNPDLKFASSLNLDILAEKYLPRGGILSGGFFYKKIDDFVYYLEQRIFVENISRPGWYFVKTAQNGLNANVMGAEVSWNQKFFNLPGQFSNFGLYFNYTYTWSKAEIAPRQGEKEFINLPGQSPHALNLALYYDGPKFYAKISGNFNDTFLDELGIKDTWDIYYYKNFNLDFNCNYYLNDKFQVFLNVNNLTNQPLKYYIGEPSRIKQQEFYSWWAYFGLRMSI
jgi:TonB-dependent receptor